MKLNFTNHFIETIEAEITSKSELKATYDSRASFYKKAHVLTLEDNTKVLKSYESLVCVYTAGTLFIASDVDRVFSTTTLRHIKEFIYQNIGKVDVDIKKLRQIKEVHSFTTKEAE